MARLPTSAWFLLLCAGLALIVALVLQSLDLYVYLDYGHAR